MKASALLTAHFPLRGQMLTTLSLEERTMSSTATWTSIPIELRLIIIEIIAGKTKKRPRIPCCKEHDPQSEDWGWTRDPDEDRVTPSAVRSVLALMQVNKRLYQDVRSIFFPGVSASFCAGYP